MTTLEQARRAKRELLRHRARWPGLAGVGLTLAPGAGYGLEVRTLRAPAAVTSMWGGLPVRLQRAGTREPLGVPRWAWSGRADLFGALDANRDGRVTRDELAEG